MTTTAMTPTQLQPGLYPNVRAHQYHSWQAASQSVLKIIRDQSPAHAYQQMTNPAPSTPAKRMGTAIHTAVLQPDVFDQEYIVAPDLDRRTKTGREEWALLVNAWGEDNILKPEEMQEIQAIRDAVLSHPTAGPLLRGDVELSALWADDETGVLCKGRFDVANKRVGALVDLKTTRDASKRAFSRAIWHYGYHIQAAHYLAGAQAHGIDAEFFVIVAVEKTPPYAVAVYNLRGDVIKAGHDELRPLIDMYAQCMESGHWPGYPTEAVEIDLPRYAWVEYEERVGLA